MQLLFSIMRDVAVAMSAVGCLGASDRSPIHGVSAETSAEGPETVVMVRFIDLEATTDRSDRAKQEKAAIKAAQQSLLDWLRGRGYDVRRATRYERLPLLSLRLDEKAMLDLESLSVEVARGRNRDVPRFAVQPQRRLQVHSRRDGAQPLRMADLRDLIGVQGTESGAGFAVIVIDDGVTPDATVELAGRVVSGGFWAINSAKLDDNGAPMVSGRDSVELGSPVHKTTGLNHGTCVAAVAAGVATNGEVDPNGILVGAKIISLRVSDESGTIMEGDVLAALADVHDHWLAVFNGGSAERPKVAAVSMSLGWDTEPYADADCSTADFAAEMQAAVQDLFDDDIPVVVSAGNDGATERLAFPACLDSTFSVGATLSVEPQSDIVPLWTNSNFASFLDLAAPGHDIYVDAGRVDVRAGTSNSAPQVAAAIAILRQQFDQCGIKQWHDALVGSTWHSVRGIYDRPFLRVDQALEKLHASCRAVAPATPSPPPSRRIVQ